MVKEKVSKKKKKSKSGPQKGGKVPGCDYAVGEFVLSFHGPLLYKAKVNNLSNHSPKNISQLWLIPVKL